MVTHAVTQRLQHLLGDPDFARDPRHRGARAPIGSRVRFAAYWASWADSMPVLGARHPRTLARRIAADRAGSQATIDARQPMQRWCCGRLSSLRCRGRRWTNFSPASHSTLGKPRGVGPESPRDAFFGARSSVSGLTDASSRAGFCEAP